MSKTNLQQSQVSGSLSYSDSVGRGDLFKANRSLADDLNSLRTQVRGILGSQSWMDAQAIDLSNLKAQLTGTLNANNVAAAGTLSVSGAATVGGILDVNNTISASAVKIDGDVAQRLYIVDADGSLKDEANMIFDGSAFKVTGAISGSGALTAGGALTVGGAAVLSSSLSVAGNTVFNNGLTVTGSLLVTGSMDMSGTAVFRNGLEIAGDSLEITGSFAVTGSSSFDGSLKIVNDVAQRLYIVDADGSMKDEANLSFNGSTLFVTGGLNVSSALTVAGLTVNTGIADFNAGVTANDVKIDGDVAQRLYIVGASGELKDEANMIFDGSALKVTGAVSGSGALQAGGALTVAGASALNSTLAVSGLATLNNGLTVNTAIADFNAGVTANDIKIDSDVAQRLYIVGASGEIKDEANMIFDGSALKVTGAISGSGALSAGGALTVAGASRLNSEVRIFGAEYVSGSLEVSGSALFKSGIEIAGDSFELTGSLMVVGASMLSGSVTVKDVLDVDGALSASVIKVDGDVAQRLYIVGASGELKDEANMIFDGSAFKVTGAMSGSGALQAGGALTVAGASALNSTLAVVGLATLNNGLTVNSAVADFNAGVTANSIKIDSDVAQRLYVVDADGSLKDEANMIFDGSALKVTGAVSGSGALQAGGTLTVAGASVLNGGLTVNSAVADFNAGVTANELKIDGDVAQRLYIVDADGSLKDESKLTFDGSTLAVNGSASFTGNVQVDGDLRVKGSMTYIDTVNMRVQDAFIYLATGSLGTSDSGIVLHGGAGVDMDLVIGQDGGAGEVIFGKGNRGPDGDGAMNGIDLVPAWMSEIKLGAKEGLFSGSLALSGSDLKVKSASGALKLVAFGDEEFSVADADQMAAFQTQFGASTTLVGAILSAAGAGGASAFRKGKLTGSAISAEYGGTLDFSSVGSLRSTGDAASGMDVYLNGVLLVQGDDYTVPSVGTVTFVAGFRVIADDSIVVVIRNAAL